MGDLKRLMFWQNYFVLPAKKQKSAKPKFRGLHSINFDTVYLAYAINNRELKTLLPIRYVDSAVLPCPLQKRFSSLLSAE